MRDTQLYACLRCSIKTTYFWSMTPADSSHYVLTVIHNVGPRVAHDSPSVGVVTSDICIRGCDEQNMQLSYSGSNRAACYCGACGHVNIYILVICDT